MAQEFTYSEFFVQAILTKGNAEQIV